MADILTDVGTHDGTWGKGHYESWVSTNGNVNIITKFDDPNKKGEFKVSLSRSEWDRLVAWVE